MGEANEILKKIDSHITYRAFKSSDGNMKVHIYELENFKK